MHICSAFNRCSSISLNQETLYFCPKFVPGNIRTTIVTVSAKSSGNKDGDGGGSVVEDAKGSGTTARGRRLLKVREEKRKREYERLHNYPSWAK